MNIFPFISNARTNVDPLSSHDAIDLYPEALGKADVLGCLPLHTLFRNVSSSIEDALMMMEKFPAALQCRNYHN